MKELREKCWWLDVLNSISKTASYFYRNSIYSKIHKMKKQNYRIKPRFNKYKIQDVPEFKFKEFHHHEKLLLQACKDIKNMNAVTAQNIKNYILIRLTFVQ